MAKKPTLTTVSSGYQSTTQLNANLNAINNALDNTLSRDGSTPNTMTAALDLNSNDLLNVATANIAVLKVAGVTVTDYSSQPTWSGPWVTATTYAVDTLAEDDGAVYICVAAHTSGTFATDLAAVKWQLFSGKSLPQSFLDEDNMVSNDDTAVASQQSIKAYVDASAYTLLDEDAMGTNSATAVASQQSIKAYVDTTVLASTAEVRTGAAGKYVTPAAAHAATAVVSLVDATNIVFDWTSGYYFDVSLTTSRTLANPTNGVVGQSRVIRVIQPAGGASVLSYGTEYVGAYGVLPTVSTGANEYSLLSIFCVASGVFAVSALINCS